MNGTIVRKSSRVRDEEPAASRTARRRGLSAPGLGVERAKGMPGLIVVSLLAAAFVGGLFGASTRASAATFRGVEFPQGAASFADTVVAYAPDTAFPFRADVTNPLEALGPPDDVEGIPAEYVSLGNGGSITLRFVNNALTGSASAAKDVWVFEIGAALEDTDVAISRDGTTWTEVGRVSGSISGIDIDPFIADPATTYSFVRLTDVAAESFSTGNTAGADIDAVGAISTVIRPADATPPAVAVPAGLTVEATGPGGALVSFAASANDLVDGPLTPVCSPAAGASFPLGETAVTCSVTDDAGNTGSAGFTLSVVDTTAPAVTVSPDLSLEATSAAGPSVNFDAPTAFDLVDGALIPTCDASSGDGFALGVTTVTCSVTDLAGNTGSAAFTISVVDTTAPTLTLPEDISAEATSAAGATVLFDAATASDLVDGAVVPTCDAASGDLFPLGTTMVACSVTDLAGNTGSGSFQVTVLDTTGPAITVPAHISVEADGTNEAPVEFTASASDLVDGPVAPACDAVSGATFPLGATTVTCTAIDVAGNVSSASFVVTVVERVYGVCVLFDQSKAVKSGAVKPIKVQLCDEAGTNLSSLELALHTIGLQRMDGTASAQVEDAGNANPDFDFRYTDGAYQFNLDTGGLASGTWHITFVVNGGAHVYRVAFDVK